jgi:hypothetical protein
MTLKNMTTWQGLLAAWLDILDILDNQIANKTKSEKYCHQ